MKQELKPVYGFVLHFGYAESSYAARLFVRHGDEGFDTLEEGLASLTEFFARNFLEGAKRHIETWERYEKDKPRRQRRDEPEAPTLDDFIGFLQEMATAQASEEPVFDAEQLETWWPWDTVQEQAPFLTGYWENIHEPAERILPRFVNIDALLPDFGRFEEFFEELRAMQTPPEATKTSAFDLEWWERKGNAQKQFLRVLPTESELTSEVVRLRTALREILSRTIARVNATDTEDVLDRETIETIETIATNALSDPAESEETKP